MRQKSCIPGTVIYSGDGIERKNKHAMIKFSKLISLCILVYICIMGTTYGFTGESYLINIWSVVLMTAYALLLVIFLTISTPRSRPLIMLFSVVNIFYVLFRFWSMLLEPQTGYDVGVVEFNRVLLYMLLGAFMAGSGMWLGSELFTPRKRSKKDLPEFPLMYLKPVLPGLFVFLFLCIDIYAFVVFAFGRFGRILEGNTLLRWSLFLINGDIMMVIFFVSILEHQRYFKKFNKLVVLVILVVYTLGRVMSGSKSAVYYPLLFYFLYRLAVDGDFKVNVKKLFVYVIPVMLIGAMTFYFGFVTRFTYFYGTKRDTTLSITDLAEVKNYKNTELYGKFYSEFKAYDIVLSAFKRLDGISPLMPIVNKMGRDPSEVVNWGDMAKATLDLCLPGRFWDDILPTSRLFSVVYGGSSIELAKLVYNTPLFTLYGTAFFHWQWTGGLIFIFLFSCFLAAVFQTISLSGTKYRVFLQAWWLLAVYYALLSMGVEEWVYACYEMLLKGALYIFVLHFLIEKKKAVPSHAYS